MKQRQVRHNNCAGSVGIVECFDRSVMFWFWNRQSIMWNIVLVSALYTIPVNGCAISNGRGYSICVFSSVMGLENGSQYSGL